MRRALAVMAVALAACSRPMPEVTIERPMEGEMPAGPKITVEIATQNATIAPVAEGREGGSHLHLFLNVDPPAVGQPIPVGQPGITHLGGGQTTFTLDSVAPGNYRLIAALGDNAHVMIRQKPDTLAFMVH